MTMNVGDVFKLSRDTRKALAKADEILGKLTDAGVHKPSVLGDLIEPTLRIKENLQTELVALERFAAKMGL